MNFNFSVTDIFKGLGLFVLGAVAFWATNKYVLPQYTGKPPVTAETAQAATTSATKQQPCANTDGGVSETYIAGSGLVLRHNAVPATEGLKFSTGLMNEVRKHGLVNRDDPKTREIVIQLAKKIGQQSNVCVRGYRMQMNS